MGWFNLPFRFPAHESQPAATAPGRIAAGETEIEEEPKQEQTDKISFCRPVARRVGCPGGRCLGCRLCCVHGKKPGYPTACCGDEWRAGVWGQQPPFWLFPWKMPRSLLRGSSLHPMRLVKRHRRDPAAASLVCALCINTMKETCFLDTIQVSDLVPRGVSQFDIVRMLKPIQGA